MRNQRKCKLDSLAKTKRMGVVFGKIESDPDSFDDGAGILIVAVPGAVRYGALPAADSDVCLCGYVFVWT
jgi:hypothetical protein